MLDAHSTEALRAFCRRATSLEAGREDRTTYIRIRQREGRAWSVVASQIAPGTEEARLEDELRERLSSLAGGPTLLELLERGSSAPRESCRLELSGRSTELEEPESIAAAAVGLMAEVRQILADTSARATEAQREARLAQQQAHETALGALQIALQSQSPAAAAMERLTEKLAPVALPLLLRRGGSRQIEGAARSPKERALEALDTLSELVGSAPELLDDPDLLARLIELGNAVGDRISALVSEEPAADG